MNRWCSCSGIGAGEDCSIHVACGSRSDALMVPVTLEEYKAAYKHWKSHSYLSGCSHGQ